MQNIYNKSESYFVYSHQKNENYFIGDKYDLIAFIATEVKDTEYLDDSRWDFGIFQDQNITMKDKVSYTGFDGKVYQKLRSLTFYDGYNRIIDIRDFRKEVVEFLRNEYKAKPRVIPYANGKNNRNYRTFHCGSKFRNKMPKTKSIINEHLNPELKEFVRGSIKMIPKYYDDKLRRFSASWKTQKKYPKQWMHKINARDCKSIRKDFQV